jgi:HEAT repeats
MPDPLQPKPPLNPTRSESAAPEPSEADVVQALVEIDDATKRAHAEIPIAPATPQSWWSRYSFPILYIFAVALVCLLLGWAAQRTFKELSSFSSISSPKNSTSARTEPQQDLDSALQSQAETLLSRVASGESAAADQILAESDTWTGKTQRTPRTDQFLEAAINHPNLHIREAALQAQLALEGISHDERGFQRLEYAVGDPGSRAWALWMLGALGHSVNPEHGAKVIGAYLDDTDVSVRANAVNGLALIATDETVPMLLDRFRNDPSPIVQERAACGLAEAGLYTHEQRMVAAASFIGWLDDSLLGAQQKTWSAQALRDITGANIGPDPSAWRAWWSSHAQQ